MGSVRFDGEDESQPSTSDGKKIKKYKSSKKLLHHCGAVNYASVPRKLRSAAIKKRGRESIILPLPIPRKQRHASNGVKTLGENGAKKSRLIKKQGHITKDEEEVAETLYALAEMFSDIAKTNEPVLDGEPSKIKSSTVVEAGSSITASEDAEILKVQEESKKMNMRVTLEAASHSSVLENSKAQVVKPQSSDDAEQPELEFSKQSPTSVSGVLSHLNLGPRPKTSRPDMIQSCETMIARDQVSASGIQYCKYHYPKEDKYKGLLMSPSLCSTEVLSSGTQGSCLGSSANRFPAWSENTNCSTQPSVTENSFTADKIHYPQVMLESKKSWKRCSTHVCITRLIKVLQKSETSKGLLLKPTHLTTTSGGVEQRLHVSFDNQKRGINSAYGVLPFNGFTQSASEKDIADVAFANLSHKSLHQDQQQDSKTSIICSSPKQGSDFLSLAAGGSDTSDGINTTGYSLDALKQFHVSYQHPQYHSAMHFSLPQNGYSSNFHGRTSSEAASQAQLPPYLSNTIGSSVTTPVGHKLESQQQKWTNQLQGQYNPGGVATPQLPDWQNGGRDSVSLSNYAQSLFPHLHSALSSKYHHFSPPQLQLMPPIDSSMALSDVERHHRRLNPAFMRNGATLYSDNMQQIQLLCNQYL